MEDRFLLKGWEEEPNLIKFQFIDGADEKDKTFEF